MPDDFTVINGTVHYEHKKPIADYDNKAPAVTLNFTIAEGSDPGVVTAKVMGIAMEIVERAIATSVTVLSTPVQEALKGELGAKKVEPEYDDPETPIVQSEPEGTPNLTMKDDLQPLAQKVSAYLRKKHGNIGALRDVIKECGGTSLLTIPKDRWDEFMICAKELLSQ